MMPAPLYSCTRPLRLALLGRLDASVPLLADALAGLASSSGWHVHIETPAPSPALHTGLKGFDLLLLAGLEPAASHGVDAAHAQAQQTEQALRTVLADAGASYQVLYGTPAERLARALHALQTLLALSPAFRPVGAGSARLAVSPRPRPKPWVWSCDKCSDPQCEYRLLTDLLASRTGTANPGGSARRAWAA